MSLLLVAWAFAAQAAPLAGDPLVVNSASQGLPFNSPRGIAMSPEHGEVLLANTGSHRVEVFDLQGRPLGHYVHMVDGPGATSVEGQPRALAVDKAGRTLVVDNLVPYVDVLDFQGRSVARISLSDSGDEAGALAVYPQGDILVATRGDSGRVYVFGPDYKLKRAWGETGKKPGQLCRITGLAVAPDGRVIVSCADTDLAIQIFSAEGAFVSGFGKHDIGAENFSLASGVAVTADGRIWTSDEIRHEVKVFDSAGSYLGTVGGWGKAPGDFLYPSALASDGKGHLVVSERVGARFQVLAIR